MTKARCDFYEVLGVPRDADTKAARKRLRLHISEHPAREEKQLYKRLREVVKDRQPE